MPASKTRRAERARAERAQRQAKAAPPPPPPNRMVAPYQAGDATVQYRVTSADKAGGPQALAQKLGTTFESIAASNGVSSLSTGQILTIPNVNAQGGAKGTYGPQAPQAPAAAEPFIPAGQSRFTPREQAQAGQGGLPSQFDQTNKNVAAGQKRAEEQFQQQQARQVSGGQSGLSYADYVAQRTRDAQIARDRMVSDLLTDLTGISSNARYNPLTGDFINAGPTQMKEVYTARELELLNKDAGTFGSQTYLVVQQAGGYSIEQQLQAEGYVKQANGDMVIQSQADQPQRIDEILHAAGKKKAWYIAANGKWKLRRNPRKKVRNEPPVPPSNYNPEDTVLNILLSSG